MNSRGPAGVEAPEVPPALRRDEECLERTVDLRVKPKQPFVGDRQCDTYGTGVGLRKVQAGLRGGLRGNPSPQLGSKLFGVEEHQYRGLNLSNTPTNPRKGVSAASSGKRDAIRRAT